VTTVLGPASSNGRVDHGAAAAAAARLRRDLPLRRSWFARDPAWPIVVTLIGWPIWWILGIIANHIFVVMAIPMLVRMHRWRREGRKVKLPPGFALWTLFMLVTAAGIFTISLQAPETIQSSVGLRTLSYLLRLIDYAGPFVFLIYAGNLTETELPRRRLAKLLGVLALYTVGGGLLGIVAPHFQIHSPLAKLLPSSLSATRSAALTAGSSQVMSVLGYSSGRVKAPFSYTNIWGECLAILLPWLIVAWRSYGSRRQRRLADAVLAVSIIPIAYSLDRGLWVAVGVSIIYLGIRYAAQGKLALLGALCGTLALAAILIAASPIGTLVSSRLNHGKSNSVRASTSRIALTDGLSSPIIGYGDSRRMQGGTQSITTGRAGSCKKCGNSEVGTSGQAQTLLITSGVVGLVCYCAFFLYGFWRYRRDRSPYGMAGILVLVLVFVFFPVYTATGPPIGFIMLSYAILWKNDRERRNADLASDSAGPPALQARTGRAALTGGLAT
jgi:hypothetical protein